MEKLKTMQLPFIILLSVLLVILFLQYQDVVEENSALKYRLSDRLAVSEITPKPMTNITDNCLEVPKNSPVLKAEFANAISENKPVETNGVSIAEIKKSKKATEIPFEFQEVDYEWATLVETAVSDAFQTSELLEKFTLKNVECRSSTCEVRMPKGQEDTFHQSVLVLFALDELGVKHKSLRVAPESEDGTVVFYFSIHDI